MAWFEKIWNTLQPGKLREELDEELRHHVALRTRDLEREGLTADNARREAVLRLGNLTLQKERMWDMNIVTWLETLLQDLHYALRQFSKAPGLGAVAVLSLALGIGANTAIFTVFNTALLQSVRARNPQELVMLTNPGASGAGVGMQVGERALLTYAEFRILRDHMTSPNGTLAGLCASDSAQGHWSVRIEAGLEEEVKGRFVSEEYFSVFGVDPALGRVFTQRDGSDIGKDPYAVISYDFWQKRFQGNRDAVGRPIRFRSSTLTIIGVAARGFQGEYVGRAPDLWVPMLMEPVLMPGKDWIHEDLSNSMDKTMWLQGFGRLKKGVKIPQIQAEADVVFSRILADGYSKTLSPVLRRRALDQHVKVKEGRAGAFEGRTQFAQELLMLLVVSGLVLVVACVNVGNLLLARSATRCREVAVRLSIGAGKGRLVRQFLTESLLLFSLGGVAGILLSLAGARGLTLLLSGLTGELELPTGLDWQVLAFTSAVTLSTGLLFGLAPAFRGARVDINHNLKEGGRNMADNRRQLPIGKALVAAQVALSMVLVVGAGLFLRTLWNLQAVSTGYNKDGLLLVRVDASALGRRDARLVSQFGGIQDRLRGIPGVQRVTYSENGLFSGTESIDFVEVEGHRSSDGNQEHSRFDQIGPGYFSTLGIPMLLGREVTAQDTFRSVPICIVNEAFSKKFFGTANPLGRHVVDTYGGGRLTMEVAGVVKNLLDHGLRDEAPPRFYVPVAQGIGGIPQAVYFEVRTGGKLQQTIGAIRKAILDGHPDLTILRTGLLETLIDQQNALPRIVAWLCTIFGVIALLLAAIGLYGVLSYAVAGRTNEIGIRMALGASTRSIAGIVLRDTAIMLLIGIFIGLIATGAAVRLVTHSLYGLSGMDPATLSIAIMILASVGFLSGYAPAARASRLDPLKALRQE